MNGHTSPPVTPAPNSESQPSPEEQAARAANLNRFELELEFVQALANPHYLESLAVQGMLNQPAFVNYLKYLTYWLDKDKGYTQFVSYPQALHHLALLQQQTFRNALKDPLLKMRLHEEQYLHWNTWRMEDELPSTSNGTTVPPAPQERPAAEPSRRRGTKPRTPGTRTPRTPRTPGSAVRTPGPGALGGRTPRGASGLSISISASDLMADSATPPGGPTPGVGVGTPLSAVPWTRPVVSPLVTGLATGEAGVGGSSIDTASGAGAAASTEANGPTPPAEVRPTLNGNGPTPHAP